MKSELKNTDLAYELIRVVMDHYPKQNQDTMSPQVSRMLHCKEEKPGVTLPFYTDRYRTLLNTYLNRSYFFLLARWNRMLRNVLGDDCEEACRQIADGLLNVMAADENDTFPGYQDRVQGRFVSRDELLKGNTEILFQPFSLAVWVWICMNAFDNRIDTKTLKAWREDKLPPHARVHVLTEEEMNQKKAAPVPAEAEKETAEVAEAQKPEEPAHPEEVSAEIAAGEPEAAPDTCYAEYLAKAAQKYSVIKTFLNPYSPTRFADCYVCPKVQWKIDWRDSFTGRGKPVAKPDLRVLLRVHKPMLLTGVGGLGKSMLLRYLLLSAVALYPEIKTVPVFVPLRDMEEDCTGMEDFVFACMRQIDAGLEYEQFEADLRRGRFLLLFDGLDEVKSALRGKAEKMLVRFTDAWPNNTFVITSRPDSPFMMFIGYTRLELQPFDMLQALEFVDRADFRPEAPEIRQGFIRLLTGGRLASHEAFTGNPLLLSILLLTYGENTEIPSEMHVFYQQAYDVLARRHDESKEGFHREWKTGLTAESLADVFSEFCARTYYMEMFDFTSAELERVFNIIQTIRGEKMPFTVWDLADDLVNGVSLMIREGDRYSFIHRSFQEFFCARYFSRSAPERIAEFGRLLEDRHARYGWGSDICLPVLYGLIPRETEKYILTGAMQKALEGCEGEDGYRMFLQKNYPVICYCVGEALPEEGSNAGKSYVYRFVTRDLAICPPVPLTLPAVPQFRVRTYYRGMLDNGEPILMIADDDMPGLVERYPEGPAGSVYQFETEKLFDEADKYPELAAALCADSCPLRQEYDRVKDYIRQLQTRFIREEKNRAYSLFE